jgi:ATP-binding cassette subfamily F protein uup
MALASLQNVHVSFGAHLVLQGLDWQIQRGEKVGLIGRNGSGKTTLFRLIQGDLQPEIGTVTTGRGV